MNLTFKNIRLLCVIIFCFYCSNVLASEDISDYEADDFFDYEFEDELFYDDDYDEGKSIIYNQLYNDNDASYNELHKCIKSKKNNFKDKSPSERIILIYLNSILDKVLSANQTILAEFSKSASEFCVTLNLGKDYSPFSAAPTLIHMNISAEYLMFQDSIDIHDSHIAASIAHEIAHILLSHHKEDRNKLRELYEKYFKKIEEDIETNFKNGNYEALNIDLNRIKSELYNPDNNNLDSSLQWELEMLLLNKWDEFYKTQPDYIELERSHEIAADNLGLRLYLNTEFDAKGFGESYLLFSSKENCITEGETAIKEGRFEEFMKSIKYKYRKPTDVHPSVFWRYWNARTQVEQYQTNTHKNLGTVSNSFYFRIDLSKTRRLTRIRRMMLNKDRRNKLLYQDISHELSRYNPLQDISDELSKYNPILPISDDELILLQYIRKSKYQTLHNLHERINEISLPSTKKMEDPNFYMITELLNSDSKISFDITSQIDNEEDIGRINDKGILTIAANDLYRIMVMIEKLGFLIYDIEKPNPFKLNPEALQNLIGKSSCISFFIAHTSEEKEVYKIIQQDMKKVFRRLL